MKKTIMPLLVCAALLCGCGGGEKTLAVQEQYRTVRTADMEAECKCMLFEMFCYGIN